MRKMRYITHRVEDGLVAWRRNKSHDGCMIQRKTVLEKSLGLAKRLGLYWSNGWAGLPCHHWYQTLCLTDVYIKTLSEINVLYPRQSVHYEWGMCFWLVGSAMENISLCGVTHIHIKIWIRCIKTFIQYVILIMVSYCVDHRQLIALISYLL